MNEWAGRKGQSFKNHSAKGGLKNLVKTLSRFFVTLKKDIGDYLAGWA